ncbi:hypothetical protein [Myxacorys almedinensis]|uniref:Uncharacterized protein n=1 Tax=Myxacorys almedinensis A TaxID=2690445 RepID=A0A8J7Z2I1_9CYAN|nr:hypothetical protein [Myxacorys almedinensis]NDJ18824.1 hypothetical protein [Myxacorys almedinensis A]
MTDFLETDEMRHIKLFLYLLPVFGFFPAIWTLYRQGGTRPERTLSRLVIKLSVGWLVAYVLLGFGATSSSSLHLPMLISASLLTSGYFLVNLWMMVQLWQRKSVGLPGVGWVKRLP